MINYWELVGFLEKSFDWKCIMRFGKNTKYWLLFWICFGNCDFKIVYPNCCLLFITLGIAVLAIGGG